MSLGQLYRDLALLTLFLGLIFTFLFALYEYVVSHEFFYFFMALIFGVLGTLMGIARYMAVIDFGSTIIKYWQRMRMRTKYCGYCGAINDLDALYCKKCGKVFEAKQPEHGRRNEWEFYAET